jgi:LysM repeat protein
LRVVHVVKRGDTLSKISRLYRKPVADIAKANNIQLTALLKVGDRLVIPSAINNKPGGFPAKIPNHGADSVEPTGEIAQAKAKDAVTHGIPRRSDVLLASTIHGRAL